MAHFVGRAAKAARGSRNHDVREDFVRLKNIFSLVVGFRNNEEVGGTELALALGAHQQQLRIKRNQGWGEARRIHEVGRSSVAEDRVVAILALGNE